jgi:predicted DNA-binding transcriptional regulator YafY
MKIDRLFSILMIIINKEKITAKELSEHFQVSVRTIQRDIDTLSMSGIPIYAEIGKNGGYHLLDNYKLDMNFLNTKEAKVIKSLLGSLEQAVPYLDIKSISNKFSMMDSDESEDNKIIVKLNPLINEETFKNNIEIITKARDSYNKINIKYIDANFKETDRIICPYTLVMMGSIWYLYGYCDLREDFRLFKLSRIVSCNLLEEEFVVMETPKPSPWEYNLDYKREGTNIILEVDKALQGKLIDYIDYRNCEIVHDKIIVNLNFPVDEWLYSFLFGLIPYVKIIEPVWLREEFLERLKLCMEKNNL